MKIKHGLILTLILAPLCTCVRIAQYFLAIDSTGYFTNAWYAPALEYTLYALLAVTALAALAMMLSKSKSIPDFKRTVSCKSSGVLFLLLAVVMLYDAGYSIGVMFKTGTVSYAGIAQLPAAAFFAVAALDILDGKQYKVLTAVLGFFPPVYVFARAITEFFTSFKHSNMSSNKIEMLTLCAMALFFMSLTAINAGADVKETRMSAVSMLCCVLCTTHALSHAVAMIEGRLEFDISMLPALLTEALLVPLCIIVLVRLSVPASQTSEPCEENIEIGMDRYIDEIPEQDEE